MMERIINFWRLCEEWAIVFANKLRNNAFLKTQITFICVLFVVTMLNILSLWYVAAYVSDETVEAIFQMWGQGLTTGVPSPAFTILELQEQLEQIQFHHLLLAGILNVAVIIALVLIVSKVALEPTRDAISSQRNFIGYTAHELRTPLAIARANIEATLLGADTVSKDACLEEMRRTIVELDALASIINNLVTLNTLSKLAPAEYHHYDLHEIVSEVVTAHKGLVEDKRLNLTVESFPGLLVWGNRNALKQMLGNIIGNAIGFTPEGKSVAIQLSQPSARYVRVVVADTGVGIPSEDLPYVFKPFYRSMAAKKHKDGSGLGLAIVRELVRLHMGKIGIASILNEGTTVTIDLPVFGRKFFPRARDPRIEKEKSVYYNYSRGRE